MRLKVDASKTKVTHCHWYKCNIFIINTNIDNIINIKSLECHFIHALNIFVIDVDTEKKVSQCT